MCIFNYASQGVYIVNIQPIFYIATFRLQISVARFKIYLLSFLLCQQPHFNQFFWTFLKWSQIAAHYKSVSESVPVDLRGLLFNPLWRCEVWCWLADQITGAWFWLHLFIKKEVLVDHEQLKKTYMSSMFSIFYMISKIKLVNI